MELKRRDHVRIQIDTVEFIVFLFAFFRTYSLISLRRSSAGTAVYKFTGERTAGARRLELCSHYSSLTVSVAIAFAVAVVAS